jgi:hypothetical protein
MHSLVNQQTGYDQSRADPIENREKLMLIISIRRYGPGNRNLLRIVDWDGHLQLMIISRPTPRIWPSYSLIYSTFIVVRQKLAHMFLNSQDI